MGRVFWRTRFGFYLAAIGSAVGLGNLWRFPYVVGENGGGAFVLLYVFISLAVGLPLLIAELILGKNSRKSVLAATEKLKSRGNKSFLWSGWLSVLIALIVFSYYAVISGWVLYFLTQFAVAFFEPAQLTDRRFESLMGSGLLQISLASVHLILTIIIVIKGVQDGLEKWISLMMPLFGVLLIALVFKSLSLSTASDALRFLFYPDFSKLSLSSLLHALGHVFFTLSVGFGTMVTFGSFLRDSDHIPTAGVRVTLVDTILSLFAGMLLFPIVLLGVDHRTTDPGLLFQTLPSFLIKLPGGTLFGFAFFLCLYLAALGASIGLMEVIVSNGVERTKKDRKIVTWVCGLMSLVIAVLPALSSSVFKDFRIYGKSLLEGFDFLMINWLLPIVALSLCVAISAGLPYAEKLKHFVDNEKIASVSLFPHWLFFIRYICPILILLGLSLGIGALF